MTDIFGNIYGGAEFSVCKKYRYQLFRVWDKTKPKIAFIGLNPSTANENENDPTIRRVISFANSWGYGGIIMYNLFAIVGSDPAILLTPIDLQKNNQWYLDGILNQCEDVCFCWGSFKEAKERAKEIISLFDNSICLGINSDGSPKHPLYVPGKTKPINFK